MLRHHQRTTRRQDPARHQEPPPSVDNQDLVRRRGAMAPSALSSQGPASSWQRTQRANKGLRERIMKSHSTSATRRSRFALQGSARAGLAALGLLGLCSSAFAADKPPLTPDTVGPFTTDSRISATIEFSLPALAGDITREI